ncbi:hypothetical protein [Alkalibaculum bacchi]|uniref:hypothetical protein n=1 Tax=Alkalibaculum bacchi TaxID=645887 RepID=UPI0026ECEC69|nr:hypothetical protein [Alkalibaculum bacchi]
MANQIPIINFVVHIVKEESYYLSNCVEHVVMVNELLQEQENLKEVDNIVVGLNRVYENIQKTIPQLEQLEDRALYGTRHSKLVYELCTDCNKILRELSNIAVLFLQVLGELEKHCEKNLFLLIIHHITIEERYGLEVLSGYIGRIASNGFMV